MHQEDDSSNNVKLPKISLDEKLVTIKEIVVKMSIRIPIIIAHFFCYFHDKFPIEMDP
jgi:hypothetical protein